MPKASSSTSFYTPEFFSEISEPALESAAALLPTVVALVEPASAVDIGCGAGAWSRSLGALGVPKVIGVDGDYVSREQLLIDPANFVSADLSSASSLTSLKERLGRFDLAISLEVAEHLDEACADALVALLISLAPVVLFSAAPPGQGGLNHVNEQWPDYWTARFRNHGYVVSDQLRWQFWNDKRVAYWYSQNILIFAEPSHPVVARLDPHHVHEPFAVIHPALYEKKMGKPRPAPPPRLHRLARQIPRSVKYEIACLSSRLRRRG